MDADYIVAHAGSVAIVTPLTKEAREHLEESVGEDVMWWGTGLAVEPRFLDGLLDGLQGDGFTVG